MSRSLLKSASDVSDSICVVCCRIVTIYAIGECDHPVCYECATRMRVLCKRNECPICRRKLPKVIFSNGKHLYSSISKVFYQRLDRRYQIYFDDVGVETSYVQLLEHRCKICEKGPTFANFNLLKDHIRRDHEKYFCDLCVENLTIFSHERKSYTRSELARHRRIGDTNDSSHRGHPLCEFCDERFHENDELFRHLRREHFFCHFCDADGFHHYYNDYEYLREHFRVEHFLCEQDDCHEEKFTTAFRTDIDLKAHKAIVHSKTLSKVKAKQARTLELEFAFKPRLPLPSSSGAHSGGAIGEHPSSSAESDVNRKFRRGGHGSNITGICVSHHLASDPLATSDDSQALHKVAGVNDASKMEIDINSENFPKLGELNTSAKQKELKSLGRIGNSSVDTLARKLAKLNRFTVGNSLGDNEFPALSHKGEAMSLVAKPSLTESSRLWASSGTASFSVTSSDCTSTTTALATKNKVTLKLNSQDDFPGLANKACKQLRPSSVSLEMHQKQEILSRDSDCSISLEVEPFVARLPSSENITFLNSSMMIPKSSKSKVRSDIFKGDISENGDGWCILQKKGAMKEPGGNSSARAGKLKKCFTADLSGNSDFPALQLNTGSLNRTWREAAHQGTHSCWKIDDSGNSLDSDSPAVDLKSEKTQTKGKKKKQKVNEASHHMVPCSGQLTTQNEGKRPPEPSKKKKKQPVSLSSDFLTANPIRKYLENQENEVPVEEEDNFQNVKLKRTELEITMLPQSEESVELITSVTDAGFSSTLSTGDGFQGVPLVGFKRKVNAPPGFYQPQDTPSVDPPPGFLSAKNVPNPPPGFGMAPLVKFPNGNGVNYSASTFKLPREYVYPDGFEVRNKQLMKKLSNVLANNKDNISNFRLFSGLFRKGDITASDYYTKCNLMMKRDKFASIFSELVCLLPDIRKQQLLLAVHSGIQKKDISSEVDPLVQFLVCAACQQVLSPDDFPTHMNQHSHNEEFPALNNLNSDSPVVQATWVKRN